jgi:hypothetical protein
MEFAKNVTFLTHIFGIHSSTGSLAEVRQKSPQTATLASVEIDFPMSGDKNNGFWY